MPIVIVNGPTIQRLDSLSDILDCSAGTLVSIISPAAWTAANLTFQVSFDGVTFIDLWRGGKQVTVACGPSRATIIQPDYNMRLIYLKFRSGTAALPVPQGMLRQFTVVIETPS